MISNQIANLQDRFDKFLICAYYNSMYDDGRLLPLTICEDFELKYMEKRSLHSFAYSVQLEELYNSGPKGICELALLRLSETINRRIKYLPHTFCIFKAVVKHDKVSEVLNFHVFDIIINEEKRTKLR